VLFIKLNDGNYFGYLLVDCVVDGFELILKL